MKRDIAEYMGLVRYWLDRDDDASVAEKALSPRPMTINDRGTVITLPCPDSKIELGKLERFAIEARSRGGEDLTMVRINTNYRHSTVDLSAQVGIHEGSRTLHFPPTREAIHKVFALALVSAFTAVVLLVVLVLNIVFT